MTQVRACDRMVDQAFAERYLAGRLSEAEAAEFEAHYLTCAECQGTIRLGVAVRHALPGVETEARARRRWFLFGVPVGLAAAVAAVILTRGAPDESVTALGAVPQAPIYLGIPVRLDSAIVADSLFADAMQAYVAERYGPAADQLRAALAAGVAAAPAEFFLGASLLMSGNPRAASEAFARVIALGDTPYGAEARYYRAKALLQLGRDRAALEELRAASDERTVIGQAARALADSITGIQRR